MADSAALLVDDILSHQRMRQWVLGFPFPLRLLFGSKPAVMGKVLGIVYCTIATHLTHKAGFTKPAAKTGAVKLIQRLGSAQNISIHFHVLFLDGVYIEDNHGTSRFRQVKAPTSDELSRLTHTIAHRVGRYLERRGMLERDAGNTYLAQEAVVISEKLRPGTGREAGLGHEDPSGHLLENNSLKVDVAFMMTALSESVPRD